MMNFNCYNNIRENEYRAAQKEHTFIYTKIIMKYTQKYHEEITTK